MNALLPSSLCSYLLRLARPADPAQRQPRSHYVMHYQELARAQVASALDEYQGLRREIGMRARGGQLDTEHSWAEPFHMSLLEQVICHVFACSLLRCREAARSCRGGRDARKCPRTAPSSGSPALTPGRALGLMRCCRGGGHGCHPQG
jgi:hypothetical protein